MSNGIRMTGVPFWNRFPIMDRQIVGRSGNPLIF
jgi:hypothetical protein